jgi:hypothetical protein
MKAVARGADKRAGRLDQSSKLALVADAPVNLRLFLANLSRGRRRYGGLGIHNHERRAHEFPKCR